MENKQRQKLKEEYKYTLKSWYLFSYFCYSWNHFMLLMPVGLQTPNAWADNWHSWTVVGSATCVCVKDIWQLVESIALPAGGLWIVHHSRERILIGGVPLRFWTRRTVFLNEAETTSRLEVRLFLRTHSGGVTPLRVCIDLSIALVTSQTNPGRLFTFWEASTSPWVGA